MINHRLQPIIKYTSLLQTELKSSESITNRPSASSLFDKINSINFKIIIKQTVLLKTEL